MSYVLARCVGTGKPSMGPVCSWVFLHSCLLCQIPRGCWGQGCTYSVRKLDEFKEIILNNTCLHQDQPVVIRSLHDLSVFAVYFLYAFTLSLSAPLEALIQFTYDLHTKRKFITRPDNLLFYTVVI